MKRTVAGFVMVFVGFAIFSLPGDANACSTCDARVPRCNPAVNVRCNVYAYSKTSMACEEYQTSCAYAYAPSEISADGSIATLASSTTKEAEGEQVRGCHGLIVKRAYAAARQAQARAGSKRIVL